MTTKNVAHASHFEGLSNVLQLLHDLAPFAIIIRLSKNLNSGGFKQLGQLGFFMRSSMSENEDFVQFHFASKAKM
jgi:hypothetical protein